MTAQTGHYNTIVLGAGMSGLACASRLVGHEFYQQPNRLLILEARNRIGGRVNSVTVDGVRCDTGANWIHGVGTSERPNPLMKILPQKRGRELSGSVFFRKPDITGRVWLESDKGQVGQCTNAAYTYDSGAEQSQSRVIPSKIAAPLNRGIWAAMGEVAESAERLSADQAKEKTILSALFDTEVFSTTLDAVPTEYHETFGGLLQFIEDMEAGPLTADSAEHAEGKKGMSVLEYTVDSFEGEQLFLQDGYTPVVEEVAKDLRARNLIRLGIEAKSVVWDRSPIAIETEQGVFTAENVVCTLPLGVLQHRLRHEGSSLNVQHGQAQTRLARPLFQPRIPYEDSIRSLGFGTLDKIFLVYESAWWNTEPFHSVLKNGLVNRSSSASSDESRSQGDMPDSFTGFTLELPGISLGRNGEVTSGPRTLFVMNLSNLTGAHALVVFVSCATASRVEKMTDREAQGLVQRAMTDWFSQAPPEASNVLVTRWSEDAFSRGSYSHMIAGLSETGHREAFATSLTNENGNTLSFAGEHTSRDHFATVHGALLSGWREADKLLSHLR